MNFLELIIWIITIIAIIGAFLNAKGKKSGFYFWIVSNIAWIIIDLYKNIPAQSFLFVVYTGISIYGLYTWSKK